MKENSVIYLIDDDKNMLEVLSSTLENLNFRVDTFLSAELFLEKMPVDLCTPSCIISDIRMPHISGLSLQKKLILKEIYIPIIFISGYADIPIAVDAMDNGALYFLSKPFDEQVLLDKISIALKKSKNILIKQHVQLKLYKNLTKREREIFSALASGQTSKEIARNFNISPNTVDIHRAHIMEKMEVRSSIGLANIYNQLNLEPAL